MNKIIKTKSTMKEILREFSEETSIHTFQQIFDPGRRIWSRVFWILVLLGGISAFVYQAEYIVRKFLSFPTTVSTSLKYNSLDFPSVTFCNNNPVKLNSIQGTDIEKYLEVYKDLIGASDPSYIIEKYSCTLYANGLVHGSEPTIYGVIPNNTGMRLAAGGFCDELIDFYNENSNFSFATTMYLRLQMKAWRDVATLLALHSRAYRNATHNISDMLLSCVYNMLSCSSKDFQIIRDAHYGACYTFIANESKVTRSGPMYGLRLMIDIQSDEYLPFIDAYGANVLIHPRDNRPMPDVDSYSVTVNHRTSIGIAMTHTKKKSYPYGMCKAGSKDVERCMLDCKLSAAAEHCNCNMSDILPSPCTTASDIICHAAFSDQFSRKNNLTIEWCNCTESCSQIEFEVTLSQKTFRMPPGLNLSKVKDVVEFEIYYQQLNFKVYEEEPSYNMVNLFSDFGGSMGLWLGASVCTLWEFMGLWLSMCLFCCGCTKTHIEKKPMKAADEISSQFKTSRKNSYQTNKAF